MLKKEDLPNSNNLGYGEEGKKYDQLIGLWTKYWNDIFNPEEKLPPNIVKALMATESGFQGRPKAPKGHKAIGIMQLMPETVGYLSSTKEARNFQIRFTLKEAWDVPINIAAAVRWLFRKKEVGESRLKRKLTWMEVIEEYKGVTGDNSPEAVEIRNSFKSYFLQLQGGMMMLIMLLFLLSCSQTSEIKINLYAKKVMDIELPVKYVLPYCSIPGDPEKKNSWLGIYVFHDNKIERLSVRHQQTS